MSKTDPYVLAYQCTNTGRMHLADDREFISASNAEAVRLTLDSKPGHMAVVTRFRWIMESQVLND